MNQLAPEDKLDFKKILPVFVIVLIDLLGLTIIIPLMPLYATSFGANAFTIGLLGAAYPIMQFIGAPILGRLSDRYGRKPVLLVSQMGTLIGFLVLGFANSLWMLFLARDHRRPLRGEYLHCPGGDHRQHQREDPHPGSRACWGRLLGWASSLDRSSPLSRWRSAAMTTVSRLSWRRSSRCSPSC